MPYGRFLAANAGGGIVWAAGITYLIWFLGLAAEQWMSRFSWSGLAAAVLVGLGMTLLVRRKTRALTRQAEAQAEVDARPQHGALAEVGAPHARARIESDRVAGRREGGD